jgi:hypothetical protein
MKYLLPIFLFSLVTPAWAEDKLPTVQQACVYMVNQETDQKVQAILALTELQLKLAAVIKERDDLRATAAK